MDEHRRQLNKTLRKMKTKATNPGIDDHHDVNGTSNEEQREDDLRRLKKLKRRAKKMAAHFAELGLDEFGEPLDNFSLLKYPVREWKFTPAIFEQPIAINPAVVTIAGVLLWGSVLLSVLYPASMSTTFQTLRAGLSKTFLWFLMGSKAAIFFFLMYTMFKYGHIRLGEKKDKPEFSTLSYFSMSFTAFAGAGILMECVQEPFAHQTSNFYAQAGYRSQDEIDMFAINMTSSNWGILFWTHYTLVAVCMSLAVHRFNLPLAVRSCFYPILGAHTWGWIGDFIDGIAIFVTIAGSSILLGMTAGQLVAGFVHLGWIDDTSTQEELNSYTNVTVWLIIFTSAASVISGLQVGIRLVSNAALAILFLLLVLGLFLDNTKFLLNLCVQEVGYFLQSSILQLNFWTDAFGQLSSGSGRAVDGKAAEDWWVDAWIIFALSTGIVTSTGLGAFVATISRGRRVGEVIFYGIVAPTACCGLWFTTFGGVGFRQSRQALELDALGTALFNNSRHFLADGHELCYDVPQEDILVDGEVEFTNGLPGVSPVCQYDAEHADSAIFKILDSFHFPGGQGMGTILSVVFLFGTALFFVAGSDAATLAIDSLASNGRKNYHWSRRMYWACTSGALATALLSFDVTVMESLYSMLLVCSLPIAILLCYLTQSVSLMCQVASQNGHRVADYEFPDQPEFDVPIYGGVFNAMEYIVSLGKVNSARVDLGMDRATKAQVAEFVKGLCVPFLPLYDVLLMMYPTNQKTNAALVATYSLCYYGSVCLLLAYGLHGVTCTLFVISGCILGTVRADFRKRHNLRSNSIGDYVAGTLVWPQVIAQMRLQVVSCDAKPSGTVLVQRRHGDGVGVDDDDRSVQL